MTKIALAQITTDPGFVSQNLHEVSETIEKARLLGADLIVFPELTLAGYCHMDLCYSSSYVEQAEQALKTLKEISKDIAIAIGYMRPIPGLSAGGGKPHLRNSVAFLADGEIQHIIDKRLLPEYDVFNERRYFEPGENPTALIEFKGTRIAVGICEDIVGIGYDLDLSQELIALNPDVVISLNASPFHIGKLTSERLPILSPLAKKIHTPIVYTNLVGSFDNYDGELVFDGQSLVLNENGDVVLCGKAFEQDLILYDTNLHYTPLSLQSHPTQDAYEALVLGIREFFRRQKLSHAFIGISGGIDSAVVAALCAEALGTEHVTGVTMPSHITSLETLSDAKVVCQALDITLLERPIGPEYDAWLGEFRRSHNGADPNGMTKQNKQARLRGQILVEYTNETPSSVVIATSNKTELALGYCTLYGDMVGALAPLVDADKMLVYDLARFINAHAQREVIPESTITRPPTAELEEGQTDEENLSASYSILSPLVNEIIETDTSREDLIKRYNETLVDDLLRRIDINEGKRRQAPPGIRLKRGSLGLETRMPMGVGYRARR
ncbi:MAG: NAD(+) synthase [Bdellovibrionales bacterium]|nr:NAD(+) synthase [Bdellovibrionales bacterium]